MIKPDQLRLLLCASLFIAGVILVGLIASQEEFHFILGGYGLMFASYMLMIHTTGRRPSMSLLISLGIIARILLLFGFPNLSDDIYRFFWDGQLWLNGINAYEFLPAEIADESLAPALQPIYSELNSPNYYSVYPGICQLLFTAAAWLAGPDIHLFSTVLKSAFIFCDIATLWLLTKWLRLNHQPIIRSMWYFLNPLVIIEGAGNMHFEVVMVFLLALFLFFLTRNHIYRSAAAVSTAIAVKLTPLIALPFVWKYFGTRKYLKFVLATVLCSSMLFFPLFNKAVIHNFSISLDLYFRSFEFNASVYYFFRWIGYQIKGWNWINTMGPLTSAIGMFAILSLLVRKSNSVFALTKTLLYAFSLHLVFSTTVHPWYVIPLVMFGSMAALKYPLYWSFLVTLSYHAYTSAGVKEMSWVIALEYSALLLAFAYEHKKTGIA